VAGKVTAGLRMYWQPTDGFTTYVTCELTAERLASSAVPMLRSRTGYPYLHYLTSEMLIYHPITQLPTTTKYERCNTLCIITNNKIEPH